MADKLTRAEWVQAQREKDPDFDAWLIEAARVVVPCDCGSDGCQGWVVRSARLVATEGAPPRRMAGTARCLDCAAAAEYANDGTLVIRHAKKCPNGRAAAGFGGTK